MKKFTLILLCLLMVGLPPSGAVMPVLLINSGSAPFSPPDIPGLRVWFKADALGLADNDPVATFTDSSGQGNNATASGTARPTFKTGVINGLPAVRFDGSTDVMTTSFTPSPGQTLFVVFNRTAASPVGNTTVNGYLFRATTVWPNVSTGNLVLSSTIFTGAWVYTSMTFNGVGTPGAWLNGTNVYSSSSGLTATGGALYLGRSFDGFYNGDIAEVINYNSVLVTSDRQKVENYLHLKYGI